MTDGYKIKRILVWQNGEEKQVYPAGWKPGANTIAYYPFTSTSTINDMKGSGTAYNLSNSGATFGTNAGVDCMVCNNSKSVYGSIATIPQGATARTFNFWVYNNSATAPGGVEMYFFCGTENTNQMILFANSGDMSGDWISQYGSGGQLASNELRKQRFNACLVYDGSKFLYYRNGSYVGSRTYTINTNGTTFRIYGRSGWNNGEKFYSNFIIENKARTESEASSHYNSTKSTYGL